MQGARPGRHEACEIRGAMGLEMPLLIAWPGVLQVIPKQEKCSRSPGRPAAASQRRISTKHVLKSPDAGLLGSPLVAMRKGPLRFRSVAAF